MSNLTDDELMCLRGDAICVVLMPGSDYTCMEPEIADTVLRLLDEHKELRARLDNAQAEITRLTSLLQEALRAIPTPGGDE